MSGLPAKRHSHHAVSSGYPVAEQSLFFQDTPGTVFFSLNPDSMQLMRCSGDVQATLGINEQGISAHGALLRAHLHELDRFSTEALLETALSSKAAYMATYRWRRPDSGEIRVLHCRAHLDPHSGYFKGFVIDLTNYVSLLQGLGSTAVTLAESLSMMRLPGLTLDLDLTIRQITSEQDLSWLSFGRRDVHIEQIVTGQSLCSGFSSAASKEFIRDTFNQVLQSPQGSLELPYSHYHITITVVSPRGEPEGFLVFAKDISEEARLRDENARLTSRIQELESAAQEAPALLNLSHDIMGYAALVERQSHNHPLLHQIACWLTSSVREMSKRATTLCGPFHPTDNSVRTKGIQPLIRSRRGAIPPTVLFASETKKAGYLEAALLSDAGIATAPVMLHEKTIVEKSNEHPTIRVIIFDVRGKSPSVAAILRSLRQLHRTVYAACLVPGEPSRFMDLQRAGAILLLAKPLTPRELERAIRGLLHLSLALDPEHTLSDSDNSLRSAHSEQ